MADPNRPRPTPPPGRRGVPDPRTTRTIPPDTPRMSEDRYLRMQATRLAVDVLKTRAIVSSSEVVTWAALFAEFIRTGQTGAPVADPTDKTGT